MHTIEDLTNYILVNRKGKAFLNWTRQQIVEIINQCLEDNSLGYAVDSDNKIVGVICAIKHGQEKVLYITAVLCTAPKLLSKFVELYNILYPGWKLEALRRDKKVTYNTDRLLKLINLRKI